MIKLVYVVTRRADFSSEAFYDYWLNRHGPLVGKQAGALHLRKHVQSHTIDDPANEAMRSVRGMLRFPNDRAGCEVVFASTVRKDRRKNLRVI